MPRPGKRWFHVTAQTLGTWLPADERGFRDKGHRIHSSGDYRRRPPQGEHAGLREYATTLAPAPVLIPAGERGAIGHALVNWFEQHQHEALAICVASTHTHIQVELPREGSKSEIGKAKRAASVAVTKKMAGRVWGRGCHVVPILDQEHQKRVLDYIVRHARERAWVWTQRDGVVSDPADTDQPRPRLCEP